MIISTGTNMSVESREPIDRDMFGDYEYVLFKIRCETFNNQNLRQKLMFSCGQSGAGKKDTSRTLLTVKNINHSM